MRGKGWSGVAFAFAVCAAPLAAQSVELRLRSDSSRSSVAGAIVRLLGASGVVDQGLTDELGRLVLRAPGAGSYRLRIDRIGYAGLMSEPFDLASGQALAKEIDVSSRPQQLPTIEVRGKSQCSANDMAGTPAGALWEEIQKALTANLITIQQGAVPLHVRQFTREVGENGRIERQWNTHAGVVREQPFISLPPADLVQLGFVRQGGDSVAFSAPDAALLLSEEFIATHCFRVVPGNGPLTGLAFLPVRGRLVPDVRGVLWVDRFTSELRFLEYGYTGLTGLEHSDVGGRVEFARLPTGAWVVSYWHVRMPLLAPSLSRTQDPRLIGYRDRGGRAEVAKDADRVLDRAVVMGRVSDATTGGGLAGTVVRVRGKPDSATTDAAGRFRLAVAASGDQLVDVTHPKLGLLRDSTSSSVLLSVGDSTTADFATPPLAAFVRNLCRGSGSLGVLGQVLGPGGRPVKGLEVKATWTAGSSLHSKAARTDPRGLFGLCNLPAGVPLSISLQSDAAAKTERVQLARGEYRWIDVRATTPRN